LICFDLRGVEHRIQGKKNKVDMTPRTNVGRGKAYTTKQLSTDLMRKKDEVKTVRAEKGAEGQTFLLTSRKKFAIRYSS